jgi:hypothetical protein
MARTMLDEYKSPHNFWGEAIATMVHVANRLFLRPVYNKVPYELLTSNKPNVSYFCIIECKCFIKNKKDRLGKFESRTIGVFLLAMLTIPMPIDTTTSPPGVLKYLVTWYSSNLMAPKRSKLFQVM